MTAPAATPVTTTTEPTSSTGTPGWVWALVALAAACLVAVIVWAVRTRRHAPELSTEERQQRIFTAVSGRTAQGWVIESESDDAAVLTRDAERVVVAVDASGRVTVNPIV